MWFNISLPARRSGVWVHAPASPFGGSSLPQWQSQSFSQREGQRAEHTHLPEPSVNVLSGLEFPGQATGTGYPPFGGWGLTRAGVGWGRGGWGGGLGASACPLYWVLKVSGVGPSPLSLGHIACKQFDLPEAHFSPLKMCIRIPILLMLGIQSDF